jgi:hypothetical protein
MMFRELKIKNKRKENTKKNTKILIGFGGGGLQPNPCDRQGMSMLVNNNLQRK